ncbi:low-density lipoprotein receptor-related protein 2-like [Oppia nitens]|uniref:low-density lipoprotein receptor-related protein 2-like n=1 Tax=Oppia nitens TaxID=1686743 RepID=UPI0023DA8383|nr:low-density lipoprotein receptor-related protein 2-like [Oppia nitens]
MATNTGLLDAPVVQDYRSADISVNITNQTVIGQLDYSLAANLLVWRVQEPDNAIYVAPIDPSGGNILGINSQSAKSQDSRTGQLLVRLSRSQSTRLSIDWIHQLCYYNLNDKIVVFNLTDPKLANGYVVVNEMFYHTVHDLVVDPRESLLFWSVSDNSFDDNKTGRLMRSGQDGSNSRALVGPGPEVKEPLVMAIDGWPGGERRVYWIDRYLFRFFSVDYDGHGLRRILESRELFTLSKFMVVYGDDILWSNYYHSSVLMTNKFGRNGSQIRYLVKGQQSVEVEAVRILDSRLQPTVEASDRCRRHRCQYLCLPIADSADSDGHHQYRCVCPQINLSNRLYPTNHNNCTESLVINL